MARPSHYWGIDLGGTKIEGVVLDSLASGRALARLRCPTEQEKGYKHILERISELVENLCLETKLRPNSIGFGTPGIIDRRSKLLKNSNTQCLNGKPLQSDLERMLGVPCKLENDANCFALAEALCGAATGAGSVFGVIMGTGVGGGFVINHKLVTGAQGIAGEWGHNILDPNGFPCYCGKRGCVETVLSGPALEKEYLRLSGVNKSLKEIIDEGRTDPASIGSRLLEHLIEWFGKALAVVINILDPEIIVLGGGLSHIDELCDMGKVSAAKYVFNDRLETTIVRNALGDSAGVFGAAMLTTS